MDQEESVSNTKKELTSNTRKELTSNTKRESRIKSQIIAQSKLLLWVFCFSIKKFAV